jgi:hypothetical protein
MNYVYYFKYTNEANEKEYIRSKVSKNYFTNIYKDIKEKTNNIINFCHNFIRKYGDVSSVSLREVNRYSRTVDFFKDNYDKK